MSDHVHLFGPGTEEYARGTSPHNSSGDEHPAFVAAPRDSADVSAIVSTAARRGLTVVPQATGHGAGGELGDDVIVIDTSALTDLAIDPEARVASAGAGLTWGAINAVAERDGLLGLAGSSPTVSICGFTFGGGLGWLTRPHGMASSALRRVDYVDGSGAIRVASEDADDALDRDALWAFRGGGGVGIATRLHFDLVAVEALHAGYLLWPIDALDDVVGAWAASMGEVGPDVATSISVLHAPPSPPFPESLRGQPVVHLAVASSRGEGTATSLLAAVRGASLPSVDTWGPGDAAKLAGIHLDPPVATPAIGDARWLTDDAPAVATEVLSVAAPTDSPLALLEIRSLGNDADARPGAETSVPGPYVWHAVGALTPQTDRAHIDDAFVQIRSATTAVDVGRSVGSWMEGATSVPDALPPAARSRVAAIADAVDPDRIIRRSRFVA